MNDGPKLGLVIAGVAGVVLLLIFFLVVRWTTIDGSERIVWQTRTGIEEEVSGAGLHLYNGLFTTPHEYYIGSETFVIDDKTVNPKNDYMTEEELEFNQPDVVPVTIPVQMDRLTAEDLAAGKSTGPTDIKLSAVMQFHLSPASKDLVSLHNDKTKAYRTTFIKDVLLETVISNTTVLDARTVFQGAGRVSLQNTIEDALKSEPRFNKYGITIEKFIIREVEFVDTEFLAKIQREALAEQRRKTAMKEERANQAEALAAKAKALTEQNQKLVAAETAKQERIAAAEASKQESILAAEANKQKITLAAEAQKEQLRLEGEGEKLRDEAKASGILAVGQATAEAKRLQLEAYQGEGGQRFAEVEKAKALGAGIQKIYYVPESMSINSIASDFQNAVTVGLPQSDK